MRRSGHIAAAALLAATWATSAGADGLTFLLDYAYGANAVDLRDDAGDLQHVTSSNVRQRYRVGLNHTLFPKLTFSGGGMFELTHASPGYTLQDSRRGPRNWNVFANLNLSGPLFNGSAGYLRQARQFAAGNTTFVTELPALTLNWLPTDLPRWSLRLSRPATFDDARELEARASEELLVTTSWRPNKPLEFSLSSGVSHPTDALRQTESLSFHHAGRVGWTQGLFDGRTSAAASLNANYRTVRVLRSGPDTFSVTALFPQLGLFAVETFPATATEIELPANAGLIDGNTTSSAGIDLGYRPRLDGDLRPRHLGAYFSDITVEKNGAYIWMDRELPVQVASAIRWTVYTSRDNRTWTRMTTDPTVTFSVFHPRFELTFERTTEPYLKFVAAPLDPAVTSAAEYEHLAVTELQILRLDPVPQAGTSDELLQASLTASAQTRINKELAHDITLLLSAASGTHQRATGAYLVTNGLTYSKKLSSALYGTARVAHSDQNSGGVHVMQLSYGASLAATPFQALACNVAYGGQTTLQVDRWTHNNSVSLTARAVPYRGIGLSGNAALSFGRGADGRWTLGDTFSLGAQATPHRRVTLGASAARNSSTVIGAGGAASSTTRFEGVASFAPFPAFYVSAAGGYTITQRASAPSGNIGLGFSPFPGGALQLGVTASQTLDTNGLVTRFLSPTVRWNIRRGTTFSASYTWLQSPNPVPHDMSSRGLAANLQVIL